MAQRRGRNSGGPKYPRSARVGETLREIIAKLEDPVENLVRKDAQFTKLKLNEDDYVGNTDAVVAVLLAYPKLLQRPVIVADDKAIIGRPLGEAKAKERLAELFG